MSDLPEITPEAAAVIRRHLESGGTWPPQPAIMRGIQDAILQPFRDAREHARNLIWPPASPPLPPDMVSGKVPPGKVPSAPTAFDSSVGLGLALASIAGPPGARFGGLAGRALMAAEKELGGAAANALGRRLAAVEPSAVQAALPMDLASRMDRARRMGFYVNRPLFHGTAPVEEFRAFDLSRSGDTTRAASARVAISTTPDPELANRYAKVAARQTGGDPAVYPLLVRASKPTAIRLTGKETDSDLAGMLKYFWAKGHDAVEVQDVYDFNMPHRATAIIFVKHPSQLRSPYAEFDLGKIGSSDLLAGVAAGGIATPAIWGSLNGGSEQ
jgi:hypothetical protein